MPADATPVLVVHGGAGRAPAVPDAPETAAALEAPTRAGWDLLAAGRSALDAVERAVAALEDAPAFNAGRGSVLTAAGRAEMDAAIMCGRSLRSGAVAVVTKPRNPIRLARVVLEEGREALLAGPEADRLASRAGLECMAPDWFVTERPRSDVEPTRGTVGAVALDVAGDLAAATSTGGVGGQRPGRVGDSPLIGAGTFADNGSCAVSCTGDGDAIIRAVLAHDVATRFGRLGRPLAAACEEALSGRFSRLGGRGGLIALSRRGDTAMAFNTPAMPRAWTDSEGRATSALGE